MFLFNRGVLINKIIRVQKKHIKTFNPLIYKLMNIKKRDNIYQPKYMKYYNPSNKQYTSKSN